MTFLDAVNRLLRIGGIIRGDTDPVVSFSDLQHGATLNLAIIAIQDELNAVMSDISFPVERAASSFTTVTNTRTYNLAADFVRFWGDVAFVYNATQNRELYEYPGGENQLRLEIFNYRTQYSNPQWWYVEEGATKQISLFPVPDSTSASVVWTYDYQKNISVTNSTDVLPFQADNEAQAFCRIASRRFKYMFEDMDIANISKDPEYNNAKADLLNLVKPKNPNRSYGNRYVSPI